MCGRATLTCPASEIAEAFEVEPIPIGPPRYNIAPGQPIVVVRRGHEREGEEMALLAWGLVPWWSKTERPKKPLVQARAETVATAPAFRDAFKGRRCLVVVDGFYEWRTAGGERLPHHLHKKTGGPFALAGVWDRWRSPDGEVVESCAVVTTDARGAVRALHDRMPLVLDGGARDTWLRGSSEQVSALVASAGPSQEARASELVIVPVSKWVNDARHDDPRCLAPAAESIEGQLGLKLF